MSRTADYYRADLSTVLEDAKRLESQVEENGDPKRKKSIWKFLYQIEYAHSVAYPGDLDRNDIISSYQFLAQDTRDPEFFESVAKDEKLPLEIQRDAVERKSLIRDLEYVETPPEGILEWYTGSLESMDEKSAYLSLVDSRGDEYDAEFDASLFKEHDIPVGGRFFCLLKREKDGLNVVILTRKARPLTDDEWKRITWDCEKLFRDDTEEPHDTQEHGNSS